MGVIIFIVLVTLALSLYDFFSSRDINRLSAKVAASKNQKYGAYALQKSQNIVLAAIVVSVLVLFGAFIGVERGFGFGFGSADPIKVEKSDTFMLTLNAPPLEHIETLPPSYKLNGKAGSGVPSSASNGQPDPPQQEKQEPEVSKVDPDKIPQNAEAAADKPKNTSEKPLNQKKLSKAEQEVYDFEKKLFEEARGNKDREEIRRKAEEAKQKREADKKNNQPVAKPTNANEGGNNGAKGKTMVNFDLNGRTPHNNDLWFIRNPGYTCGQGVSGEVVVKIKVNANGDVTSAETVGNVSGINPCLVEQSKAYAKKSRFNASGTALQEGTITYRFVP